MELGVAVTPRQVLARAEDALAARRRADVEALGALLAWADLHSEDPDDGQPATGRRPSQRGRPRLITLGGDGTPEVVDLALLEIAIARHEGVITTRHTMADALDLRHRLPQVWAAVNELRIEVWVARKIATMSRQLTRDQARIVDIAVAEAADESAGVLLTITEAKVIEADPGAHEARITGSKRTKGVWITKPRPGDAVDHTKTPGVRGLHATLDDADAVELGAMVDQLAERLADHDAEQTPAPTRTLNGHPSGGTDADAPVVPDRKPIDHYRAEALAMLADPQAVLDFLATSSHAEPEFAPPDQPDLTPPRAAQVFVHLSAEVLAGLRSGIARVEGLGPYLLGQLRDLLRHQHVALTPVVDLNVGRSVRSYEHPTDVKLRSELRTVGDVFPHSSAWINHAGRSVDHDHPVPYDADGPPGQTGDHNDAPLRRHHHRGKTHLPYTVFQTGPASWVWSTPHGLHRRVTTSGTHDLTTVEYTTLRRLSVDLRDHDTDDDTGDAA